MELMQFVPGHDRFPLQANYIGMNQFNCVIRIRTIKVFFGCKQHVTRVLN